MVNLTDPSYNYFEFKVTLIQWRNGLKLIFFKKETQSAKYLIKKRKTCIQKIWNNCLSIVLHKSIWELSNILVRTTVAKLLQNKRRSYL